MRPALEFHVDHLVVRLPGLAAVASLRRAIVVPYSDLASAEAVVPEHPPLLVWRVGTHLPGVAWYGSFWDRGRRRFLSFHRGTRRALMLRLQGHPQYDDLVLDVEDPDAAAAETRLRAGLTR